MSALVYIVGGIVALLIFTGGVWMSIHRIRGRNSETGDLPTVRLTSRRGDRFTGGFRIRRRPRGWPGDAERPELPENRDPEFQSADQGDVLNAPPLPAPVIPLTVPTVADPSASSAVVAPRPGGSRPIAWLKAVQGIVLDVLLTQEEVVIGRDPACNIVIDEETVSRKHCALVFRSGRWYIRPFRTPNGTYVNDALAEPDALTPLKSKDALGIGPDVVLKITMPEAARIPVQLRTGAATSVGGREQNEDNYLATATLIGVADGVGGRPAGGLASRIAIDMLRGAPDSLSLSQFVPAISAVIRARSAGDPDTENMATTLDAVQLVPDDGGYRMSGVHIGDGLALVDDGTQIRQLTTPHTLGAELARQGNPASAHHPERAGLLRAIGLHDRTEADMWSQPALIGSRFILTTDGLINALGLKKLFRYLEQMRGDDPEQVAEALIGRALQHPADSAALDNLTIVVADLVEQSTEEQPGQPERPVPAALPSGIHRHAPPTSGLTGAARPEKKLRFT